VRRLADVRLPGILAKANFAMSLKRRIAASMKTR
jgi:hypothetical protein